MQTDHEQARLRATYADLLDDEDAEELLPFLGALDAVHSTPPLPTSVRNALDQPRWAARQRPQPVTIPGAKARPRPIRTSIAWVRDRLAPPQRPQVRRWSSLNQAINAATTLALVLSIALAAFLLLGQPIRPGQGNAAPTNGNWVYPGALDGRSGIVSVAPDGTARLLIEGGFYGVTPSPDGQRLIAYGNRDPRVWNEPITTAALYTAEGQLIRRYTLGGATPLIPYWSPDSRHIAFFTRIGADVGLSGDFHTWLLDENGEQELRLGRQTLVGTASGTGTWSSRGELLLSVVAANSATDSPNTQPEHRETWVIQADGSNPRRLGDDALVYFGWSRDGRTAYLLSPGTITAVEVGSGSRKTVAHFADITSELRSQAARQGISDSTLTDTTFETGPFSIAPSGDRFAIWLIPAAAENATSTPSPYLVVLDLQGRIVGVTRGEANTQPRFVAWSPDGNHIAYSFVTPGSFLGGVRVISSADTALADTPATLAKIADQTPDVLSLRWSPDSRQLAFSTNGLIEIANGDNFAERRRLPGVMYGWPNWQPAP